MRAPGQNCGLITGLAVNVRSVSVERFELMRRRCGANFAQVLFGTFRARDNNDRRPGH